MRLLSTLLVATLLLGSWMTATLAQPVAAPSPTPAPVLKVIPLGPNGAPLTTPSPNAALLKYSGQLLDVEKGYAFFTTGNGFRVAPDVKVLDAKTGKPYAGEPGVRLYATATFDKTTGKIVELDVSKAPIPNSQQYALPEIQEQVDKLAVSQSQLTPNNDEHLNAYRGPPMTGKPVAVTFVVQVPPSTPLIDQVYISTDVANWDPRSILMTRIDALHYRATTNFASGTAFHYKYDRGSFRTIEVGRDGLDDPPRSFVVRESDALRRDDVVYNWKDASVGIGSQAIGPNSIPSPFNPAGILGLPTPPAPFGPTPVKTLPPGIGGAPPGGARGGLGAKH
jgi:hypothetical protein